jgi:ABC-type transport system involved in cytochrome c biogenesis permease subunit
MAVLAIFPIIMLVFLVIFIVPFWFICKKAGFSPWLALVNLLPMGTLILLYILAFAEWKVVPAPQPAYQPFPYPPQPPVPPIAPPLA